MEQVSDEQVIAGQAVYSKFSLMLYDTFVNGYSCRFVWKCPSFHIQNLYNQHISGNHLDIGVGTGYFIDNCIFPTDKPRVGLMDLNPNSLAFTKKRLTRYNPEIYQKNVLEPFELETEHYDSVGVTHLLHCIPGTMRSKHVVFRHIKEVLNPNGVVFGATLLHNGVKQGLLSKRYMRIYNSKGIMHNRDDSFVALKFILDQHFSESSVEVIGCDALFWAK